VLNVDSIKIMDQSETTMKINVSDIILYQINKINDELLEYSNNNNEIKLLYENYFILINKINIK
jgi:hypothetical protein